MTKVLVPLDTSERSKRALATADQLACALNAELILLTVLETQDEDDDEVTSLLDDMTAGLASACRVRIEYGLPTSAILAVIDEELPELVVMSSHGGASFDDMALSSVAKDIVMHSSVPVTLVGQAKTAGVG
jgi:nucleotide-binding universal stress UspA family protein